MPGVTVTLADPGTIGGNQVTVTDRGEPISSRGWCLGATPYRGAHRLRTITVQDIVVNAEATARADLRVAGRMSSRNP